MDIGPLLVGEDHQLGSRGYASAQLPCQQSMLFGCESGDVDAVQW